MWEIVWIGKDVCKVSYLKATFYKDVLPDPMARDHGVWYKCVQSITFSSCSRNWQCSTTLQRWKLHCEKTQCHRLSDIVLAEVIPSDLTYQLQQLSNLPRSLRSDPTPTDWQSFCSRHPVQQRRLQHLPTKAPKCLSFIVFACLWELDNKNPEDLSLILMVSLSYFSVLYQCIAFVWCSRKNWVFFYLTVNMRLEVPLCASNFGLRVMYTQHYCIMW